jgi:hypothetical protein
MSQRSRARPDDEPSRSGSAWSATGRYDPATPAGSAEQFDRFLAGLARLRGGRRVVAQLAALAVLLLILMVLAGATIRLLR